MLMYSYNAEQFLTLIFAVYMRKVLSGENRRNPYYSINYSPQTFHIFHKQKKNICADCKRPQLNFNIHSYSLLSYRIVIFPGEFSST